GGVIDRNLSIAISQFAPGSQTVKDDELHTAFGIVGYEAYRDEFRETPDPLGDPIHVGICRRCQGLSEAPDPLGACPYCGAARNPESGNRTVELSEPPGFCSLWYPKAEFSGSFEFSPRALKARMGTRQNAPVTRHNFVADCLAQGRVHRINDN